MSFRRGPELLKPLEMLGNVVDSESSRPDRLVPIDSSTPAPTTVPDVRTAFASALDPTKRVAIDDPSILRTERERKEEAEELAGLQYAAWVGRRYGMGDGPSKDEGRTVRARFTNRVLGSYKRP